MRLKDVGYVRVAAASIPVSIADPYTNVNYIVDTITQAQKVDVEVLVFPALTLTGSTCGDLFRQELLLNESLKALKAVLKATAGNTMLISLGLPLRVDGQIYNAAAVIQSGKLLAFIPSENSTQQDSCFDPVLFRFSEQHTSSHVKFYGEEIPFQRDILFVDKDSDLSIAVHVCKNLLEPHVPELQQATVHLHLASSPEIVGKNNLRSDMLRWLSLRQQSAEVYASSSSDESTSDYIYSGHCLIAERGELLESNQYQQKGPYIVTDVDVDTPACLRSSRGSSVVSEHSVMKISFSRDEKSRTLLRQYSPYPFLPHASDEERYYSEVLHLQATAYMQRMKKTGLHLSHIGISGGLDSTWALIVALKAHEMLGTSKDNIRCITMPGFGTSDASRKSAHQICSLLGLALREIPIVDVTLQHFRDIGHDPQDLSLTYENAQARERTQILMDLANKEGGLVVGTGDLSEIALGWSTYNGDQMSMYGINASVPKTLLRAILAWYAHKQPEDLKRALLTVLQRPVSPELLPLDAQGAIVQKTEDSLGDYDVNDFFLYYVVRTGYSPKKILYLASLAFKERYSQKELCHTLRIFYRRFITQQFKRNAAPDSAKVLPVSLSSRTEWRMPSDASSRLFMMELDKLEEELS